MLSLVLSLKSLIILEISAHNNLAIIRVLDLDKLHIFSLSLLTLLQFGDVSSGSVRSGSA